MRKSVFSLLAILALCLNLLPGTAWAAEDPDGSVPDLRAAPGDINMAYQYFVFAQGVPIVIRQNGSITSIYDTEGNLLSGDTDVSSHAVYGGWYDSGNSHTGGASIVMESGTVKEIYGGSFGDVLDGNTNIVLDGGTVGWVFGGGNQSEVTGTAHVTVNSGAKVWGQKISDPSADLGAVYGGGYAGTVSSTEVVFNGGDAGWIYGGGNGGCTCTSTHVKFMGQADGYIEVYGGGYGGSVGTAVVEFHAAGPAPDGRAAFVSGSGWNDQVDTVEIIIGESCDPPGDNGLYQGSFFAKNPFNDASTVSSAVFEVHAACDSSGVIRPRLAGVNGEGVAGTTAVQVFGDANTDQNYDFGLYGIDNLTVESGSFSLRSPMTLNRLEVNDAGTVVIPAAGGTTSLGTLAGSGTVLFRKGVSEQAALPVEVTSSVQIPGGSKIKVGHTGGGWADTWGNTLLFQGAGITALDSASCFSSRDTGFYLTKTEDGTGIQVQEGTEQKATDIYPTPHFDRPSYQYGETMTITMGLRSEGQDPVPGQTLEVRGGVSGLQTFATAVTDAGGEARFTLPVDDNLWASRESGLQAIFHGTENYKESFYGISLRDKPDSMSYIVTGAQIALDGEITAPARGEVPVKTLPVSGGGICTAEVIWAPADAVFRPEVTYTAGIRLVPKPGFRLGDGKLASATYQGSELTLPAAPEADGSMLLANVETFAAIPAIHPTGVTLSASALTLSPGGGSQLTASVAPENADNKAVVWTSSNPAVAEVDASGQVTAKGAGTAVITVTTADGSFTAFCTVTVTSASGGSSGSGGSGGGTGGGSPATTTTKNPDGTTTTTTTDPAAGTVTATTKAPDGTSVTVVTDRKGSVISAEASIPGGVQSATLPAVIDRDTGIKITVKGGGSAEVEIPAEKVTPGTVAVIVAPDGTETVVRKSVPTENGVVLTVEGSAVVKLAERGRTFSDLPGTHWAADAAAFVSARELFSGTAPDTFSPSLPMSRAMLAAALHNLENNPGQNLDSGFDDVRENAWYAGAVNWAAANSIINGYSSRQFGPGDPITREQLAVMLWRYAGRPAPPNLLLPFDDADQVSPWAADALRWAVDRGILRGKGSGILAPKDTATRAEAAQMIKNFLEK